MTSSTTFFVSVGTDDSSLLPMSGKLLRQADDYLLVLAGNSTAAAAIGTCRNG
ncbi:hypothetical protein ACX93W_14130 [Paenibacillus sp. CAU 1782]